MTDLIHAIADWLGFAARPYGVAGTALIILYALQAELRFGARARSSKAGATDRGSTWVVTPGGDDTGLWLQSYGHEAFQPSATRPVVLDWLFGASLPGLPASAWPPRRSVSWESCCACGRC